MFSRYCLYCMVLILKPRVGEIVLMSSPLMRLMMVVLPALSRPLGRGGKEKCGGSRLYFVCNRWREHAMFHVRTMPYLHHEETHFLLLGLDLFDDGHETHGCCGERARGRRPGDIKQKQKIMHIIVLTPSRTDEARVSNFRSTSEHVKERYILPTRLDVRARGFYEMPILEV